MNDREMKKAIDACRPEAEDVRLPEMSELAEALEHDPRARRWFERSRQWDAAVGEAFRDVAVPEGLAARLLDAVQDAGGTSSVGDGPEPLKSSNESVPFALESHCARRWSGRRVAAVLAGVAAVAACWLALVRIGGEDVISEETISGEVALWIGQLQRNGWRDDLGDPALRDYPLDRCVRQLPRRWSPVRTRYDAHAVAYDLAGPGRAMAVVFCIRNPNGRSSLASIPTRIPSTGGMVIGAWQRDGRVYVLAVRGDERRYRSLVEARLILG